MLDNFEWQLINSTGHEPFGPDSKLQATVLKHVISKIVPLLFRKYNMGKIVFVIIAQIAGQF